MRNWKIYAIALGPAIAIAVALFVFNPAIFEGDRGWYVALAIGALLGGTSAIAFKTWRGE